MGRGSRRRAVSDPCPDALLVPLLQFLYRWDLEWCPMFGTLKTLLLNEWFTAIDLVCILRYSPVLEMLTLQLGNTKNLIGATAAPETIEQSFVCGHLEAVKIVCIKVDVGIRKISSILSTFGVDYKKISIEEKSFSSNCKLPGSCFIFSMFLQFSYLF